MVFYDTRCRCCPALNPDNGPYNFLYRWGVRHMLVEFFMLAILLYLITSQDNDVEQAVCLYALFGSCLSLFGASIPCCCFSNPLGWRTCFFLQVLAALDRVACIVLLIGGGNLEGGSSARPPLSQLSMESTVFLVRIITLCAIILTTMSTVPFYYHTKKASWLANISPINRSFVAPLALQQHDRVGDSDDDNDNEEDYNDIDLELGLGAAEGNHDDDDDANYILLKKKRAAAAGSGAGGGAGVSRRRAQQLSAEELLELRELGLSRKELSNMVAMGALNDLDIEALGMLDELEYLDDDGDDDGNLRRLLLAAAGREEGEQEEDEEEEEAAAAELDQLVAGEFGDITGKRPSFITITGVETPLMTGVVETPPQQQQQQQPLTTKTAATATPSNAKNDTAGVGDSRRAVGSQHSTGKGFMVPGKGFMMVPPPLQAEAPPAPRQQPHTYNEQLRKQPQFKRPLQLGRHHPSYPLANTPAANYHNNTTTGGAAGSSNSSSRGLTDAAQTSGSGAYNRGIFAPDSYRKDSGDIYPAHSIDGHSAPRYSEMGSDADGEVDGGVSIVSGAVHGIGGIVDNQGNQFHAPKIIGGAPSQVVAVVRSNNNRSDHADKNSRNIIHSVPRPPLPLAPPPPRTAATITAPAADVVGIASGRKGVLTNSTTTLLSNNNINIRDDGPKQGAQDYNEDDDDDDDIVLAAKLLT